MAERLENSHPLSAIVRKRTSALYRGPGDRFFKALIVFLSSGIVILALAMGIVLAWESKDTFAAFGIWDFLTGTTWDPVAGIHGTLPFIMGTLITSFGALLLALIPSLSVAIFVSEYAPKWLATIINYTIDLLAAIPSVVIGLWAIFNFAPFMRDTFWMPIYLWAEVNAQWVVPYLGIPSTYNLATATIILALMIVPYTVALSRDAIKLVPQEQKEAAWALGATRWEVMVTAVLPYARSGIVAGVLLSLARALGETMAVAMLIGNANRPSWFVPFPEGLPDFQLPYFSLFGSAATMPSLIINEFREAVENLHYTSIMTVGFYLFVMTIGINLLANVIQRKLAKGRIKE